MWITLNGDETEIEPGTTVAQLLERRQVPARYCAVERNLQLVPRAAHADCILQPGDRLEIVTLVGGG